MADDQHINTLPLRDSREQVLAISTSPEEGENVCASLTL